MKRKINALIIMLSFTMMTGCTSDFKVDEQAVEKISDKVTSTVMGNLGKEKAEKIESQNINGDKLENLVIENSVGDIYITTHDSSEIIVDTTIKTSSSTKESAEKLLRETTYSVESRWNDLVIDASQINRTYGEAENAAIDLNIKLPSNIGKIYINNNVGNLKIENYDGKIVCKINVGNIDILNSNSSYSLTTDVGDINLTNCLMFDKSDFYTNTGNVVITADDISDAKVIEADVQVGDISLTLPSDSSYQSTIKSFMENELKETKGNGNTKISLNSKVGEVNFK